MLERKRIFAVLLGYLLVVIALIGLVPLVLDDYVLAAIYAGITALFMLFKKQRADWLFVGIGFVGLLLGEYFFVSIGVETFNRRSLLGTMPLWLPFLWAFIFLAIKRVFWMLFKYLAKNPEFRNPLDRNKIN